MSPPFRFPSSHLSNNSQCPALHNRPQKAHRSLHQVPLLRPVLLQKGLPLRLHGRQGARAEGPGPGHGPRLLGNVLLPARHGVEVRRDGLVRRVEEVPGREVEAVRQQRHVEPDARVRATHAGGRDVGLLEMKCQQTLS